MAHWNDLLQAYLPKVSKELLKRFTLKRLYLIYSLPLIITLCLLSVFDVFQQPDHFFSDRMFQWRGTQQPSPELAIVAISERDFERGAPRWPWPRSLMARLIDQISASGPAVIVVDILYTERTNTEAVLTKKQFAAIQPYLYQVLSGKELEIQSRRGTQVIGPGTPAFELVASGAELAQAQDLELAVAVRDAIENGVAVVLAAQTVSGKGVTGLVNPYPDLANASNNSIGLVGVRLDADGVLRRYIPYGQDKDGRFIYGLALQGVARLKGIELPDRPLVNGDVPIGQDSVVKVRDGRFVVNFSGPPGTYPTWSAGEVLRGEGDFSEKLNGRIVFIGVTDPSSEDLQPTPYSGTNRMAGVEFHAAAADTILSGSYIKSTSGSQRILLLVVLGLGSICFGRFTRPLCGLTGTMVLLAAVFGGWSGSFIGGNYLLPISGPLATVLSGYAFALIDRVGVEQLEKRQARSMLSRYLSPDVVREVLKNPLGAQLEGRRTDLTVLFSDIRGFTTLAEKLTPEEVVELLNKYLTVMTEIIFRYGGTVDKFEGDAILVFFGAPQPYEDQGERAVRTALEMRDRLSELQEDWIERTEDPLRIGIAIHSGEVMVGNIGSQLRMDYTVIGDTVNLASRLQDMTKELDASILISGSTQTLVQHMCELRNLGSTKVRGRQQAVDIYEVVNLKTEATGFNATTTRRDFAEKERFSSE